METKYDNAHIYFYIIGKKISAAIENILMLSSFSIIKKANNKSITFVFCISYMFTHVFFI